MPRKVKALLSWSSGKDSAWALHVLRSNAAHTDACEVVGLVTTINESADRIAMHAVRRTLLAAQATAAELPLWEVPIPHPCSNEQYEEAMERTIARAKKEGVEMFAFGDLFLEDVRRYREDRLAPTGIVPCFPLWQEPTDRLARRMQDAGLRATLTCVDPKQLTPDFVGREFDEHLLNDLPPGVDPCGERGEFHTFAYDGPMFSHAIETRLGRIVEREGFVFADLEPTG